MRDLKEVPVKPASKTVEHPAKLDEQQEDRLETLATKHMIENMRTPSIFEIGPNLGLKLPN